MSFKIKYWYAINVLFVLKSLSKTEWLQLTSDGLVLRFFIAFSN